VGHEGKIVVVAGSGRSGRRGMSGGKTERRSVGGRRRRRKASVGIQPILVFELKEQVGGEKKINDASEFAAGLLDSRLRAPDPPSSHSARNRLNSIFAFRFREQMGLLLLIIR
jgi:hypothetical protein